MSEPFSTIGGVATKDEAYRKLMHHIDECRNQCLVIGHLCNTEDDQRSKLLAKGWYGIEEMLTMMRVQILEIAKGKMQ